MKRITLVFVLLLIFIKVPNSLAFYDGKVFITNPHQDYSPYFLEEGDYAVNNYIDWSKEGQYKFNYYNEKRDQVCSSDVLVATNETLTADPFLKLPYYNLDINPNYEINDFFLISNNDLVVVGRIRISYQDNEYQDGVFHPFIAYYENGELIWEHINTDFVGAWTKITETDDSFLLLGYKLYPQAAQNVVVCEVNYNGKQLRFKELIGNRSDNGRNIFYDNGTIYIAGITYSDSDDFQGNNGNYAKIFMCSLNYNNFDSSIITTYGNDLHNEIIDVAMSSDGMYILANFYGNGYLSSNKNHTSSPTRIIFLNHYHELISYHIFKQDERFERLIQYKNNIYVLSSRINNNYSSIHLYHFLLSLREIKTEKLRLPENYIVNSAFDAYIGNECLWIHLTSPNGTQILLGYSLHLDPLYYQKITDAFNHSQLVLAADNLYLLSIRNKKIVIEWVLFVSLDQNTHSITVNNHKLNKAKINELTNVDEEIFGTYDEYYLHSNGNVKVFTTNQVTIAPQVNIRSNEEYDVGVVLFFNGVGYLNGQEINNGYQINNSGKYLLEVEGKDDNRLYNFTVGELSQPLPVNDYHPPTLDQIEISHDSIIPEPITEYSPFDEQLSKGKANNNIFKILVIILCSGLLGWVLPHKTKRQQK